MVKGKNRPVASTPYTGMIQRYINDENDREHVQATFVTVDTDRFIRSHARVNGTTGMENQYQDVGIVQEIKEVFGAETEDNAKRRRFPLRQNLIRTIRISISILLAIPAKVLHKRYIYPTFLSWREGADRAQSLIRPDFVFEHPYITSSYYTNTNSTVTLIRTEKLQVEPKRDRPSDRERGIVSRIAIVRPFCEFDAEDLPTTFACWNSMVPCRAAEQDLGDYVDPGEETDEWVIFDMSVNGTGRKLNDEDKDNWECEADYNSTSWFRGVAYSLFKRCKRKPKAKEYFDDVPVDGLRSTSADLFLFYSQTFADSPVAMRAVDEIINEFFSPGGTCSIALFALFCFLYRKRLTFSFD